MQVSQVENILKVQVSPKEILNHLSDGRVHIEDFEYLCGLIYLIALAKKRKKSVDTIRDHIDNDFGIQRVNRTASANMCLQILENAGISQKGIASVRNLMRKEKAVIENGVVVSAPGHFSLDAIDECGTCNGIISRAMEAGVKFVYNGQVSELPANRWFIASKVLRVGLLALVVERNPDYVIEMEYDMSITNYWD
jgi:hypothetical protein